MNFLNLVKLYIKFQLPTMAGTGQTFSCGGGLVVLLLATLVFIFGPKLRTIGFEIRPEPSFSM